MSHLSKYRLLCLVFVFGAIFTGSGCAVPQPRGGGSYTYVKEPSTNSWYHLYLPVDYVKNNGKHPNPRMNAWPLVMTFHGMKPYDNAHSQEREWEQEADIYGYIVCAPELNTSNSFMEYPLTKEHEYVLKDRQNVIAIMEHVYQTTNADRRRVLSTSWSCGGYLAHYFANRFPDRFSCLATRLSNFSPSLLMEDTLPLYKDRVPVAIFIGDGDFPACKSESEEAVAWYEAHGFRTVRGKMIDNIGHARIPQTCSAFFAEQLGIEPLHPLEAARTVAKVRMTEYYPPQEMIAKYSPQQRITPIPTPTPAQPAVLASSTPTRQDTISRASAPREMAPAVSNPSPQFASSYMSSGAGRNYPDRAPLYEPQVSRQQLNANVTTPPRGPVAQPQVSPASDTRPLAQTFPVETQSSVKQIPVSMTKGNNASPPSNPQPAPAKQSSGRSKSRDNSAGSSQKYASSTPKSDPGNNSAALARQQIAAAPGRSYGVAPVSGMPKGGASSPPSASRSFTNQTRVNKVGIRLNGPKVGTSPHPIEYSVDMPPDKLEGADFLWMDNGVWMSADATGKKVLQSPGMHQISVLLVTKDDVEYRGAATVQVLDPGPGGGAY